MDLDYIIRPKTGGANPFKIFKRLPELNQEALAFTIKRMTYEVFLRTAYWFAVSQEAKSRALMRCQVCNCPDNIQAHHRTYDSHGREHINMIDIIVLCSHCHGLFHGQMPTYQRPRLAGNGIKIKLPGNFSVPHQPDDVSQLPDGAQIVLTGDLIQRCRANGSFTNATLRALGRNRGNMTHGWVSRLIGESIPREKYLEALEGRFIYKSGPLDKAA